MNNTEPREPSPAELVAIGHEASTSRMHIEIALEVARTSPTFRKLMSDDKTKNPSEADA